VTDLILSGIRILIALLSVGIAIASILNLRKLKRLQSERPQKDRKMADMLLPDARFRSPTAVQLCDMRDGMVRLELPCTWTPPGDSSIKALVLEPDSTWEPPAGALNRSTSRSKIRGDFLIEEIEGGVGRSKEVFRSDALALMDCWVGRDPSQRTEVDRDPLPELAGLCLKHLQALDRSADKETTGHAVAQFIEMVSAAIAQPRRLRLTLPIQASRAARYHFSLTGAVPEPVFLTLHMITKYEIPRDPAYEYKSYLDPNKPPWLR